MNAAVLRINHIQFFDQEPLLSTDGSPAYPGAEGGVWYLAVRPGEENQFWYLQIFRRGPHGKLSNWKHSDGDNRGNVWGWNGDREKPSLSTSFVCPSPRGSIKNHPYVHLFLREGRIDLLPDSEVVLDDHS